MFFTIVMCVAMLVVAVFAAREVAQYRRRDGYKLRRLTLRLSMAAMLLFLFASVWVGVQFYGLANPVGFDRLWIAFWAFIGLLTVAIFCLVLADLSAIQQDAATDTSALLREMAQIIAEHKQEPSDVTRNRNDQP